MYLSARNMPSGPGETPANSIEMRAAQGANRGMLLSTEDRVLFRAPTGAYYVCFYAYTDFSAKILVDEFYTPETDQPYNYLLEDGKITTQLLRDGAGALIGRFTNPAMRYYGNITFYIEFQGLRFNQPAPTVYYTVCKRRPEDCQFDPVFALSVAGDGRAFAELPGGVATMENAREYVLDTTRASATAMATRAPTYLRCRTTTTTS